MASVLYITQDGITDHIGQAQIAPYILGLAREGHDIHVVSAEKAGRSTLRAKYEKMFTDAGVRWSSVRYANKPPLISSFWVLWRMYRMAAKIAGVEKPQIIHCRAYLPLELAVRLKRRFGAKLLVDFRDFWADVGLEKKPFKFVYRQLKRRERSYIGSADHIVTLTERAADILMTWYPTAVEGRRDGYTVIPCCADFLHFDPARINAAAVAERRRELSLGEGPVLLYLGSLGHDYLLREMLRTFKELLEIRPNAVFLFVSNNARQEVERQAAIEGISLKSIRYVSVDRACVPEHIALADFSVVFIRPTLSKAGCSPTKLAELFALNVPVIANAGVGDMDAIVDYERNGSVIAEDFSPETLRAAVQRILDLPLRRRKAIRAASEQFALVEGIRRYDAIYERLAPPTRASRAGEVAPG
jgi:glycosyltransferase involved in cell wall biosynthesis